MHLQTSPQPLRRQLLVAVTSGLVCLLLVLPAWGAAGRIELPDMGASAGAALSPAQEKEIGKEFMRAVRQELVVLDDPDIDAYINSVGTDLSARSGAHNQSFTFFVVKDNAINAFAAPGGYIAVNSGLILASQSEAELAAVLAHEIAHVTQRHIARRFEAMNNMRLPSLAAMAAAILIGMASPDAGMAAMAAAQAGQAQMQLDFTRANELEADRVGMQTLAETDFDPRAMPAFFERLQLATRYYGRPPEFLSSHPVTENRIADTRGRAEQYPYKQRADSLAYQLVRAKLAVMTAQSPRAAVEKFEQAVKTGRYQSKEAASYGYALALAAAGDKEGARRQLRALYQQDPDNIAYRSALAKVELAAGNTDTSLRLYADGLDLYPDNKQLVQGYAEALLEAQRPGEARSLLRDYKRNQALDPPLYRLLALSEGRAGDSIEGLLAMAEYHHQMGDTALAIQQLEQARKLGTKDFYQASRIEAELKELKNELAEREGKR